MIINGDPLGDFLQDLIMNGFTKEELIEIAEYCNWQPCNTAHSDFRRNLRIKIQFMIDNYCGHDEEGGEIEIFVDTCKKCDAYLLSDKHYENQ